MLDTLGLKIPLTRWQYDRVYQIGLDSDDDQLATFSPRTGEIRLLRMKGLSDAKLESWQRDIRWDLDRTWVEGESGICLEFSIPKFWYGHNIHLLYDWHPAVQEIRRILNKRFKLVGKHSLCPVDDWLVFRADFCYAWRCPSQATAQNLLDSLKRIRFPRKKPSIFPTSINFAGATYSVKVYLKKPEFCSHDKKAMIKAKVSESYIQHLEEKADGVLRFEVTARRVFLLRYGINTVKDLNTCGLTTTFNETDRYQDFDPYHAAISILKYNIAAGIVEDDFFGKVSLASKIIDGKRLEAPEVILEHNRSGKWTEYNHRGGGATFYLTAKPINILKLMLKKYVGENPCMDTLSKVEEKLKSTYKPVIAARLLSMWLYVQRLGNAKCKEDFGDRAYYYNKRMMKKAGVDLIEPPSNVTPIDRDFWSAYRMSIPSPYVTNKVDDYRDSDNVLNLPKTP